MKGVCDSDPGCESISTNVFSLYTVHRHGWAGQARHCWNFEVPSRLSLDQLVPGSPRRVVVRVVVVVPRWGY